MPMTMTAPSTYKSFEERWEWIITFMVLEDMFVHEVLMMMEKRPTTSIATMGVSVLDATLILYYNPEFIRKLSDAELRYVVTHEIYHVVLHHCTVRRPEDLKQQGIWNKAADLAINSLIPESADRCMPKGDMKGLKPKDFGFDEKLSMEQYLQLLRDKGDDGSNGSGGVYGSSGSGEGGEGKGKPGQGQGFDDHGGWRESEIVKEIIRNKVEQLATRERSWGNMAGDIKAMILAAQKSKVDWRKLLRHFLGLLPTSRQQSTFTKPNRRYGWPYCGTKRLHVDRKLVAIDTSGSIGDDELAQFLVEVNKLCEIQPVDLQLFDHELQGKCMPFERKRAKFDFAGRGGTAFTPVFKFAEEHRYQSLIILTDGAAEAPDKPAHVKDILWVITGGGKPPVEWGRTVFIIPKGGTSKSK